jgi:hypothetical protein
VAGSDKHDRAPRKAEPLTSEKTTVES